MRPSEWLSWLHAHAIADQLDAYIVLSKKVSEKQWPSKSVHIADVVDVDELIDGKPQWYARCQLTDRKIDGPKRGTKTESGYMTHFWVDLDTSDGDHGDNDLRPTRIEAEKIIETMTPKPSAVLHSGGGFYLIWRLAEPFRVDNETSKQRFRDIAERIENTVRAFGYKVDNVADISRLLRPAGVINGKYGTTVTVESILDYQDFTIDNLDAQLLPLPQPAKTERQPIAAAGNGQSYAAVFASMFTIADVLHADPIDQWTPNGNAGKWELWHREGSGNPTSLKYDTDTGVTVIMSATVQSRLGVTMDDGLTLYRLACLLTGANEHDPHNTPGRLGEMLHDAANQRNQEKTKPADEWMAEIEAQQKAKADEPADQENELLNAMLDELIAGEIGADELHKLPPLSWFVDGWIRANALNVVYGPAKAGKSFWTMSLALEAAIGRQWAGHIFDKPKKVCYFAAEDPESHAERIRGWLQANNIEAPASLRLQTKQIKLNNPLWAKGIRLYLEKQGPFDLVVIDTLNAATPGMEENSAKEMSQINYDLEKIVKTLPPKSALILNHHAGKSEGSGPRGSSSLDGAHRSLINIKTDKATNTIKVTQEKVRDGAAMEPLNYRIRTQTLPPDADGRCREIGVMEAVDYQTAITEVGTEVYEALKATFGFDDTFTAADIGQASGLTGGSLQRLITIGVERSPRMWERFGNGRATKYRLMRRPGETGVLTFS